MSKNIWILAALSLILLPGCGGSGSRPTAARGYRYTLIADSSGPFSRLDLGAPSGVGGGGPSVNNRGTVAFLAFLNPGGQGIFTGDGGPTTTIIRPPSYFSGFSLNDEGMVAFGLVRLGHPSISAGTFIGNGGPTTTIFNGGSVYHSPSINNRGMVAFAKEPTAPGPGEGSDILIADGSGFRSLGVTGQPLANRGSPSINDAGTVAFLAGSLPPNPGVGLYISDNGVNTLVASTNGPFTNIENASINDRGAVVFRAAFQGSDGQPKIGIFTGGVGAITNIADTSGPFGRLGDCSINNGGKIAFHVVLSI